MTSSLANRVAHAGPGATLRSLSATAADDMAVLRRGEAAVHPAGPARAGRPSVSSRRVTLDLDALEAAGRIAAVTSRSEMAESFRRIKRPLVTHARDAGSAASRRAMIMVTSAVAGEGKTFCAANLALSLAGEIDSRVLLVDADPEHPGLMRHLQAPSDLGLLDLLSRPELQLADVVLQTNVPRLELLPSGTPHALPAELLASDAMRHVLAMLAAERDRLVVFDASALLGSAVGHVLAERVGQIVLVVEASVTRRRQVVQALSALEHCDLVMLLLNRARPPRLKRRPPGPHD